MRCHSCGYDLPNNPEYRGKKPSVQRVGRRLRVQLPSGGTATVTPEGAKDPALIKALDEMMQAVKRSVERGELESPTGKPSDRP